MVSSRGASVSSELAILTAPLKSPSSSFAETRAAKDLSGSLERYWPLLGQGSAVASGGSVSTSICLLTRVANEPPWAPLRGNLKQRELKRDKRSHEV